MTTQGMGQRTLYSKNVLVSSLIAGGVAGTAVDTILFPLDTVKTRLQSKNGFWKTGAFVGLYKGLFTVVLGSAPTAALFFVTYESFKSVMEPRVLEKYHSFLHMGAASCGEMISCLIRVPVEAVKQRKQALLLDKGSFGLRVLYRGYWSTVLRDVPFSLIQFPIWEHFKRVWSRGMEKDILPVESAICGAVAGGISAAITNPLDVAKTRIMLSSKTCQSSELKIYRIIQELYKEKGISGLCAGMVPRVMWITIGGFIFFGVYEQARVTVRNYLTSPQFYDEDKIR